MRCGVRSFLWAGLLLRCAVVLLPCAAAAEQSGNENRAAAPQENDGRAPEGYRAIAPHAEQGAAPQENRGIMPSDDRTMVRIAAGRFPVGTSDDQRQALARRYDCHPTWLGDDLARRDADLAAFWIDRRPVTNAEFLAFVEATGHPRPAWWNHWGGGFPEGYADHPVVGVSGQCAAAFARWAGKRLPTAEEWEAAVGGPEEKTFAWGDDWPGPLELLPRERIWWELPGTRPVGGGRCGQNAAGLEDFAGQALEWVADVRPYHGVQFQLLKGASWFHEDPLSFRTAAGWWAYEGWRSSFTGFRCALDGDAAPRPVPRALPRQSIAPAAAAEQLAAAAKEGPLELDAAGGASRHLAIRVPRWGAERFSLTAPETIQWNGASVMTWRLTPDMTWTERSPRRAAYEMRFAALTVRAEFLAGDDRLEQRFTAVSGADQAGRFTTSSCFSLQSHPQFYDCEQLRTYVLTAAGEFFPTRRLARHAECVRWITGFRPEPAGGPLPWAVLAVVARDGRHVVATGRLDQGGGLGVGTNALFTCLHADSTIVVPPAGEATARQVFWFLEGGLDDLRARLRRDLAPDVAAGEGAGDAP